MRGFKVMTFMNVPLRFTRRSLAVTGILLLSLIMLGRWGLGQAWGSAFLYGLIATGLHWGGEIAHQYGHVYMARRTGYPMTALRSWYLLIASFYPRDEPELPPLVHIKRALGGPVVSLTLALIGLLLWLFLPATGVTQELVRFFMLENLLVFCIGSLLPLGFTDGSTLLYWVPRWRAQIRRERIS